MAVTTAQTTDVTAILAELLRTVENLRVYEWVADSARVPCVVVSQPTLTFNDPESTFCHALWDFNLGVVTTRSSDRAAQALMSQYLLDIVQALSTPVVDGVISIEPVDATPVTVQVSGTDLPGYQIRVRIRA